jgi:ABC-type transport system involved in multi-copper enzyme maturation permease subunit
MLSLVRTWAIARYELTWDLRKRRTPVVVGLILLASFYFAYLVPIIFGKSITEEPTLLGVSFGSGLWWVNTVYDVFNLFASGLFPLLIGGFIAADSLATEFDENTIVPLLSQPVRRSEVYLGKFFAKLLILLAVAVLFTLVTIGFSQASLGSQGNLGMIPLVLFAEFGAFLEFAAIGFFLGSIARSGMFVLGLLFGLFFGVIWTVLLLGFQYGIQETMFLLPVANAAFLLQVIPYYVFQPWGVMVLQGVALGDYTQQTAVTVISAMEYVLAGLAVNLLAFLVAGYYFFRKAEVKG